MMLRMMTDPESVIAINQDPNSSMEDRVLSKLAAEHVIENKGTDRLVDRALEAGQSGEECCIM